jgi:hypothetical protein
VMVRFGWLRALQSLARIYGDATFG